MKKIFLLILVYLALTSSVKADLLYYTFEGEVYYSAEKKVKEKDRAKIVLSVDFNGAGFYTYSDETIPDLIFEDYLNDEYELGYTVDYFYSDVVSGLMITEPILDSKVEYNLGASYFFPNITTPSDEWGFICGGNDCDLFCILSSNSVVSTWKINDEFDGLERVALSNGDTLYIYSELVLKSISNSYTAPESSFSIYTPYESPPSISTVPEPPILCTLPLGLLFISGIYGLLRKKNDTDKSNCKSNS